MRTGLKLSGVVILGLLAAGCPAFMLGSVVGTVGYAGYEYAKTGAVPGATPQAQPSAQPTLSLNSIE